MMKIIEKKYYNSYMSIEIKKLKNPPIKEVIMGVACEGLFKTFDEIKSFVKSSSISTDYPVIDEAHNVMFDIGLAPSIRQSNSIGYRLLPRDESEEIHLELNKIMFIDKNKYDSFDNFWGKFKSVLSKIFEYKGNQIEVQDIGLRYVNQFLFSNEQLARRFYLKQSIGSKTGERYFNMLNSLYISQIQSVNDTNIFGVIKHILQPDNEVSTNVVFDIDTHINNTILLENIDSLKSNLLKLKEFKNTIFFSNFDDATTIEEFN